MDIEANTLDLWSNTPEVEISTANNMATAIVWIRSNASDIAQLLANQAKELPGIHSVKLGESTPNVLTINFNFNKIRYADIVDHLNNLGFSAKVVGY